MHLLLYEGIRPGVGVIKVTGYNFDGTIYSDTNTKVEVMSTEEDIFPERISLVNDKGENSETISKDVPNGAIYTLNVNIEPEEAVYSDITIEINYTNVSNPNKNWLVVEKTSDKVFTINRKLKPFNAGVDYAIAELTPIVTSVDGSVKVRGESFIYSLQNWKLF